VLHIVLFEPEIPQNTGNISRTCAALGARLHLIEPLGFRLDERQLRRAGLDYWPLVDMELHRNLEDFFHAHEASGNGGRAPAPLFYLSARAQKPYIQAEFPAEVFFMFGRESTGLPDELLAANPGRCLRIPMREGLRSLNLSNCAAIIAYEYARQQGFPDMA
jgi:tRNA (cytidine/uridine-2'-O-)-methyltransferase